MGPYLFTVLLAFGAFPRPAHALRLVTTSPQVTELAFDLGKGNDVVAVSAYSFYPEAAKKLPVLGGLFLPSIERTLALRAEALVFDLMNGNSGYSAASEALKIPRYEFAMTGIDAVVADSRSFLKAAYGEAAPAADRLAACVAGYRPKRRFRYLAFTWFDPPIAFGQKTFLSDLLFRLGGDNAVPESLGPPFPQLSLEWILARQVDYVFFLTEAPGSRELTEKTLRHWWPKQTPMAIALPADDFARGGFTPVRQADTLPMVEPKTGWRACLDAKL